MHWSDARGSIRDSAHTSTRIKELPGGKRGQGGRRGGVGVGRWGQRRGHRRRGELNEASRKEVAGWKDTQVDVGCWRRGSCRRRRATLSLGFSDERWPFFGEDRRKEESRLTSFRKMVEAFHQISTALQHNNSLRFFARVAPGVHGTDELGCMGSA